MNNFSFQCSISTKHPKPKAIIVDIDGTLANNQHRLKYIETSPKNWEQFNLEAVNDGYYEDIIDLLNLFKIDTWNPYIIILVTGRMEKYRCLTEKWLFECESHIPYEHLYMRPNGDFREDYIVKEEIYNRYIEDKYNVKFVFDDRDQVVKMWRSLGLRCLQVKEGDF